MPINPPIRKIKPNDSGIVPIKGISSPIDQSKPIPKNKKFVRIANILIGYLNLISKLF
jgi:hypothetical protein